MTNKILLLLLTLGFPSVFICGQIGINTEYPVGILHVDGAGDNTSLTPSETQQLNDVIVTSNGDLGIGTNSPITKVDLKSNLSNGIPALRIQDSSGSMPNKVLESGADGVAFWSAQPTSVTKTYAAKPGQKFLKSSSVRNNLETTEDIVIPQAGKYLLTLRWWSYYRYNNAPGKKISIYVYVVKRGKAGDLDQIEYYLQANQNNVVTFTTSLYLSDCIAGEIIDVQIRPMIGGAKDGDVHTELYPNDTRPELMPQVILYSI